MRELSSSGSLVFPALRGLYPELQLGAARDAHRPRSPKALQGFPEVGGGLWSGQGALAGQMGQTSSGTVPAPPAPGGHPSTGLGFKKVLKPSIRRARHPHPAAKCDGSVTILKPSMNIACGSTYWSLPCMAAWAWFNVGLSGNASQGGITGDQPFWCQQERVWGERQGVSPGALPGMGLWAGLNASLRSLTLGREQYMGHLPAGRALGRSTGTGISSALSGATGGRGGSDLMQTSPVFLTPIIRAGHPAPAAVVTDHKVRTARGKPPPEGALR